MENRWPKGVGFTRSPNVPVCILGCKNHAAQADKSRTDDQDILSAYLISEESEDEADDYVAEHGQSHEKTNQLVAVSKLLQMQGLVMLASITVCPSKLRDR